MGEMGMLSGMMFCADCGAKLYQVRANGWTHDKEYFVCATYRKQKVLFAKLFDGSVFNLNDAEYLIFQGCLQNT